MIAATAASSVQASKIGRFGAGTPYTWSQTQAEWKPRRSSSSATARASCQLRLICGSVAPNCIELVMDSSSARSLRDDAVPACRLRAVQARVGGAHELGGRLAVVGRARDAGRERERIAGSPCASDSNAARTFSATAIAPSRVVSGSTSASSSPP